MVESTIESRSDTSQKSGGSQIAWVAWTLVVLGVAVVAVMFGGTVWSVQAATGIPAIIILLVVMNWFFHKVYWNGWISHHNKRRRNIVSSAGSSAAGHTLLGLGMLGFTSVYREGFEIVI